VLGVSPIEDEYSDVGGETVASCSSLQHGLHMAPKCIKHGVTKTLKNDSTKKMNSEALLCNLFASTFGPF
jgi:hypothetical protein